MIARGFSVPVNVRLPTPSSHSQIRRRVVLLQNSYGRFRLETAGRVMELRQAEHDPERTFAVKTLLYLDVRLSEILPTPPCTFAQAIVIRKSLIFGFLNPLEGFSV